LNIPYNRIYSRSVERVILSSLIFQPELIDETSSEINKQDFYIPFYRNVYSVLLYLEENKKPLSEEHIKEELERRKQYNEEEFFNIFLESPIANIEFYLKDLKDRSVKRQLLQVAKIIEDSVYEQDMDSFEVLNLVESKIYDITQDGYTKGFRDSPEIVESTKTYIEEMSKRENKEVTGLPTGFAQLNKMTTGFNVGELIIVAARPAMGKTAFALNIVNTILKNKRGVAFFSLEMSAEQLMLRTLSLETKIPLQDLRTGNIDNENDWYKLNSTLQNFKERLFFIDDDGNLNINQLRSKLRKLKSKYQEIDFAVIDYLQIMGSAGNKDRQMEVSEISRGLKMLARELNIPIMALSQLNRSLESRNDKRPIMSDIRESGSIEQDADIILFVYRDDVYRLKAEKEKEQEAKNKGEKYTPQYEEQGEEIAEIIIGKQRNGPTGNVKLSFQKKFTRFLDFEDLNTQYDQEVGLNTTLTNEYQYDSNEELDSDGMPF
jgi:replicative DNA helicase